jgi:hypothetical protein
MIELQPGDCFVVKTDSRIAGLINWGERLKSKDNAADYNHAGIIVSGDGTTFESLAHIAHYDIDGYKGYPLYIVRHLEMTPERFQAGYGGINKFDHCDYPWWRLFLHLAGLAKFIHWSYPVCSELVGRFLYEAGLFKSTGWGWNPDDFSDLWDESKNWKLIFKGKWDGLA